MNLKFFVLIPNLLFPAVLLLMGSVFYQIRTLKSELGCQSLLHFPSGVLTPTAHFCGFAFCFLLKWNALLLLQISFWRKKKTNKWIWVRTWAYTSARRQAAQYPRVCCSFLGGAPMQPCPRGAMDIPSPADCKFSYITAYQTECKSNLVSSFLQSILLQICTFQWRWSLSFSRTLYYSNIRHRKSFWQVSYLQRNE